MQKFWFGLAVAFGVMACSNDEDPVDCEKSGLILSLGTVVNASQCGVPDGSLKVFGSGGKEPYQFSIKNGPTQDNGQFNNLPAGLYTIVLTDANACNTTIDNVYIKAQDFSFTADITDDNSCLGSNGAVTLQVSSGNPPYLFAIGTSDFSENNTFTGLPVGYQTIVVKDNAGCTVNLGITISRGFSGTSWANDIKPIIETKCSVSGCHDGTRPDLRVFANAKANAKNMKLKTQDRSMPKEGSLTDAEIQLIACWVDDGALAN
ncbi:hypothetical protein [Chryseolinea soli]|uniref:SprB repeat-containing protein n=1 Tax=Chryseolinea soli TaxID=2321403 RepID=A0A385SSM6_9BACT|nr:hypothetical protein [Chryseolinea soli]AYB33874.1 hypothetical protein D4L85_26315 [Chryseolinea soli]